MMTGFERYTKKTRRAVFLEEMEQVVPWAKLCALIEPHYPKPGNGRRPKELEKMLRIYFLQQWFNLADPAVEEALYDSATLRQFAGIDLGGEPVPDETTVCNFRHLLEEHNLGEEILGTVNLHLQAIGSADYDRHDRGRDDYSRALLDQEPRAKARPGDASAQKRKSVVFRDEGARGGGQQDETDSHGGGDGGERFRCGDLARSPARRRDAGVGRWGLSGTNGSDPAGRAAGARLHPTTLSLQRSDCGQSGMDEEPDKVKGAVQGRARLSGDEAEVWIRESAVPRAEEKRASFVCHLRSGQSISKSQETAAGGVTAVLLGMAKATRRALETTF